MAKRQKEAKRAMNSGLNEFKSGKYISPLLSKVLCPGLTYVDIGTRQDNFMAVAVNLVGPAGHVYAFDFYLAALKLKDVVAESGMSGTELVSLDEQFKGKNWPPVNVVNLAVGGAEAEIINGMKELCQRNRGIKVIVSLPLISPAIRFDKFWNELKDCGLFRIKIIDKKIRECRIPEDLPALLAKSEGEGLRFLCEAPFAESPSTKEGDQIITAVGKLIPSGRLKKLLAKLFDSQVFLFNRIVLDYTT